MTGQTATPRHPTVQHALTAAWSLRQARQRLIALAIAETSRNVAVQLPAAHILRSPVWGGRHGTGGHGDPTGVAVDLHVTADRSLRETWWTDRMAEADKRLRWLADSVGAPGLRNPMRRLIDRIPALLPGTAAVVVKHLVDEDRWIRETTRLDPDERLLPGAECPACGRRPMAARTAAPDPDDWAAVCPAGCLCTGQGCGCGMLMRAEGVAHIWTRATPAVAAMLDRLGQREAA